MVVVGIDPGQKGGLGALSSDGKFLQVIPMPLAGKEVDFGQVASFLLSFEDLQVVVVEQVSAMRKKGVRQGTVSSFKFGANYGGLLGVVAALAACSPSLGDLLLVRPLPQKWKSDVLEGTKKDKDASVAYVRRSWPKANLLATSRSRVLHDGMADALCLAEYGRRLRA